MLKFWNNSRGYYNEVITLAKNMERETNLDILRFFALIAVIIVHASAGSTYNVYSEDWVILNCFASCLSWEIPIFVMISGRFFLDSQKTITPKIMITKYIKRLLIAFVVWSAAFQFYYYLSGTNELNWKGYVIEFFIGRYPFWYLQMLMGLYLITPFLRVLVKDKKLVELFIILSFIFNGINKVAEYIPGIGYAIEIVMKQSSLHFILGYSGYFLLGYYLYKYPISVRLEKCLYTLLPILLILSCYATTVHSRLVGENQDLFSTYLMPNIAIESVAIYTFFVKRVGKCKFSQYTQNFFSKMTEYSFGVYLVHVIVNEIVCKMGLTSTFMSPFIAVPLVTVVVFLSSFVIVWIIRKIPYVGKRIT